MNFNDAASKSVGLDACISGSSQDSILSSPETGGAVGIPLPPRTHGRATLSRWHNSFSCGPGQWKSTTFSWHQTLNLIVLKRRLVINDGNSDNYSSVQGTLMYTVSFAHLSSPVKVTEACPLNPSLLPLLKSLLPQIEKAHTPSSYWWSLQNLLLKNWVGKEVNVAGNRVKGNITRKSSCYYFKSKQEDANLSIQFGRTICYVNVCLEKKWLGGNIPQC